MYLMFIFAGTMKPETKYKIVSLVFFFVLFTAFVLQFLFPYVLDPTITTGRPKLTNNVLLLPVIILAALVFVYQVILYTKVRNEVKLMPLLGAGILLVMVIIAHYTVQEKNLDQETRNKIIERLQHRN